MRRRARCRKWIRSAPTCQSRIQAIPSCQHQPRQGDAAAAGDGEQWGARPQKSPRSSRAFSHSPVLPATIAAAAEAEGDAGAAAVIARTVAAIVAGTVIAVPARRIVVVAAVVRPVVTVAPVVMAMPPMPMAVLRADIRRGL